MPIATLNMVRLDRRQRESLQTQLYRQIRGLIMSGQLPAGVRLPSTRDLVGQLGASRNTIVYAFEQLVAEGYLDSRVGGHLCCGSSGSKKSISLKGFCANSSNFPPSNFTSSLASFRGSGCARIYNATSSAVSSLPGGRRTLSSQNVEPSALLCA